MTQALGPLSIQPDRYSAGACNIGPAEIARRRMSGHLGLAVAVGLLAVLVLTGAPHLLRLLLFVPAMISAAGYLQAHFHFCAAFGTRGVYNFDALGKVTTVAQPGDRRRDLMKSMRIFGAAIVIGVVVAVVAALLPF